MFEIREGHPVHLPDGMQYPEEAVQMHTLPDSREVMVRPAMALDTVLVTAYLNSMPIEDLRSRFHTMASTPHTRLQQVPRWYEGLDYHDKMTFIAIDRNAGGAVRAVGFVHAVVSVGSHDVLSGVEIAISRHVDYRGSGLADVLVATALRWCTDIGAPHAFFIVADSNGPMQKLAERAGGIRRRHPDEPGESIYGVTAPFQWESQMAAGVQRTGTND